VSLVTVNPMSPQTPASFWMWADMLKKTAKFATLAVGGGMTGVCGHIASWLLSSFMDGVDKLIYEAINEGGWNTGTFGTSWQLAAACIKQCDVWFGSVVDVELILVAFFEAMIVALGLLAAAWMLRLVVWVTYDVVGVNFTS